MELLIVTGMSGAGKSTVIQVLEDMNYFCVDNLPPALFVKFFELIEESEEPDRKVALVVDVRAGRHFTDVMKYIEEFKKSQIQLQILFLESSTEAIIDRFKETRRPHPMKDRCEGMIEGIAEERKRLENIRGQADLIIDTSDMLPSELRERIRHLWGKKNMALFRVSFLSFGYKYGVPIDADLLVDVRFLPNPFYVKELREKTGQDQVVQDYVFAQEDTAEFIEKYLSLLQFLLPRYKKEGKSNLVIGIGCTGGKHRSVTLVNHFASLMEASEYHVEKRHRDIARK